MLWFSGKIGNAMSCMDCKPLSIFKTSWFLFKVGLADNISRQVHSTCLKTYLPTPGTIVRHISLAFRKELLDTQDVFTVVPVWHRVIGFIERSELPNSPRKAGRSGHTISLLTTLF
jgi:hypothetical protein